MIELSQILTALKPLPSIFLQSWRIWLIIGLISLIRLAIYLFQVWKLSKSRITEIDRMDGKTFERYLGLLFEKLGYTVERVGHVGDFGADLILSKDGVKTAVQAKCYKRENVGIKAIQEAFGSVGYYHCEKAMVVTNSYFTNAAKTLAVSDNVELWGRKELINKLLTVRKNSGEKLTAPVVACKSQSKCAICGMVVSEKVRQYCIDHSERFGGKIYCFDHQRKG